MRSAAPLISRDLLEYLQGIFPNTLPKGVPTPSDMGILVGQQKVVNHLRVEYQRQNPLGTPLG